MFEIECICCGAELSGRHPHLRPVTSSMCECCARQMKRAQLALEIFKRENHPALIH